MANATLYVPVHYYEASNQNDTRTIYRDLGASIFVLPYYSQSYGTGMIVDNGAATDLFTTWGNGINNFQAAGNMMLDVSGVAHSYDNFVHYFPAVQPVSLTHQLAVENTRNGRIMVLNRNYGATTYVYESRAAFMAGAAPITEAAGTEMAWYFRGNDATGARRGRAALMFYTGINADGILTGMVTVSFEGATSTSSSIYITGTGPQNLSVMNALLGDTLQPYTPGYADPYEEGGVSGTGGGTGDWRIVDDPIDFPELPTISVAEAGFLSIWVPTISQLQDLSACMWCADPTKIAFWKQMISNPIDLILGLQLLPFEITVETSPARVTLGFIDSGINMYYTDQQFWEIDCGELDISEYWGAFLDYGPYTSMEIYLPFIGVKALNVNDCMPKTIHVKYMVDIVTGTCIALIKCGSSLFYHFTGSCAAQVPVTSGQAQQLFGKALSIGSSIALGAASGGIAGALAATVGASSTVASAGGLAGADRSGSLSGTAGFMDTKTPYLIVTRPRQAVPDKQNELTGYPAFITETLGDLVGYTEVQVTHLHNMSATQPEIDEIVRLLQGGVFF